PRTCLRRRPGAHRPALLYELSRAAVHSGRAPGGRGLRAVSVPVPLITPRDHGEGMRKGALLRPRNLLIAVFGLLLLIQLVPVWLFQTNPPVVAEPAWNSP